MTDNYEQQIKQQAINMAKQTGTPHYVISILEDDGYKYQGTPVSWYVFLDFEITQIEFVAFSHTSSANTIPTEATQARFDTHNHLYERYIKKLARNSQLTWQKFTMENAQ